MVKDHVFQFHFQLAQPLQLLQFWMFALQASNQTELEIALYHQFQLFALLDIQVMEMESVFLYNHQNLFLTLAHLEKPVMEWETVFQHQYHCHANMDLKQILKETVFQFYQLQVHQ
jgi:hypothetical protein